VLGSSHLEPTTRETKSDEIGSKFTTVGSRNKAGMSSSVNRCVHQERTVLVDVMMVDGNDEQQLPTFPHARYF
jgi:hypothetical protein